MRGAGLTLALAAGLLTRLGSAAAPQQQLPSPTPVATTVPQTGTAAISGTVTDGVTKQPIADAVVELAQRTDLRWDSLQRVFTDARGRYVFAGLPGSDAYVVSAKKPGYFSNASGAAGNYAAAAPISLADGQWFSTANVTLWPPASISGRVTDESGEPLIGVFVRLLAQVRIGATTRWAAGVLAMTDDRGVYRVGNLPAGRYAVMVPSVQSSVFASASLPELLNTRAQALQSFANEGGTIEIDPIVQIDPATARVVMKGYPVPPPPLDGRSLTYPISFAGGKRIDEATMVGVEAGENRTAVDIRLEPIAAVRISGVVDGPPDARANVFIRLMARGLEDLGWGGEASTTLSGPDGSFVFANVPAGNYVLDVPTSMNEYTIFSNLALYAPQLPRPPGISSVSRSGSAPFSGTSFAFTQMPLSGRTMWARTAVSAGPNDTGGVVVSLQPALSFGGRVVVERATGSPAPAQPPQYISVQSATGSPWQGTRGGLSARSVPAGEFRIDNLVGGDYLVMADENPGWMVKSVIFSGRDHTYMPINLTTSSSDVVITFTNSIPELRGSVMTSAGASSANVIVVAYPFEREQWTNNGIRPPRIKVTQASTNGSFRFANLPAGRYYVTASPSANASAWREPGFFERAAPTATEVTFNWGEKRAISVRLVDVR